MALINCPVCGDKVSDKAVKCIHCGSAIVTNKMDNNTQSLNQSGTLIGDNAITSQPTLINSSDTQNAQEVIKKFKKSVVIGIVVAFLVIVAAIVVGIFIHQKIEDNKKKKAEKKQEQVEAEYMDKVAPTRLALDRYYIEKQTVNYDIKMISNVALQPVGHQHEHNLTIKHPTDCLVAYTLRPNDSLCTQLADARQETACQFPAK